MVKCPRCGKEAEPTGFSRERGDRFYCHDCDKGFFKEVER